MEIDCGLVRMCIESATESRDAVEAWRRQLRTLERLPSQLADALLHRLLRRRLLFPSLLQAFKDCVEEVNLKGENIVDAEWLAYLGGFKYLRTLNLSECRRINSSSLFYISGMTTLKELDLSRCSKITDAGIRFLLSIPTLEKLWIAETGATAKGVVLLCSLSNLSVLDLGGLPVTDAALSSLQALTKLQHLVLWGSEVSDEGASVLKTFRGLRFLNLGWTKVSRLPILPSLACLDMSYCMVNSLFEGEGEKMMLERLILSRSTFSNSSEAEAFLNIQESCLSALDLSYTNLMSFSFLVAMYSITELDLCGCYRFGDDSVEYILSTGERLRYLNLSKTGVTSAGVGTLAGHVPNLETLLLSHTAVDDNAISYISTMPSLKIINLICTNVKGQLNRVESDFSLSALQSLDHLERLDLDGIQIKDSALYPLSSFFKLGYLSLNNINLSDACFSLLSQIRNLVYLGLCDALLTDEGLDSFKPPSGLKVLDLTNCWLLTKDGLSSFCQKYPLIEVMHMLVTNLPFDKAGSNHSYSSKLPARTSEYKRDHGKQPLPPLDMSKNKSFIDQRVKYSREELLAMGPVSATSSNAGQHQSET